MIQKEGDSSEEFKNSPQPNVGAKLISFLDSKLGTLLIATIIGIVGLFTWQREDWLSKEQFYRDQVIFDRRVELIEGANKDVGQFLANADTAVAVFEKQAPPEQRNEAIEAYNLQQKQWFGAYRAYDALMGVYFSTTVSDKFSEIVSATTRLDVQLYLLSKSDRETVSQAAIDARQGSTEISRLIQEWNNLVKGELYRPQSGDNEV